MWSTSTAWSQLIRAILTSAFKQARHILSERITGYRPVGRLSERRVTIPPPGLSPPYRALLLALSRDYPRDYYYYSRDHYYYYYYCHSLVILVGFSNGGRQRCRQQILCFFKIDVYEITSHLPETSSGYTRHGDEKSGSGVLFILHSVGVDEHLWTKLGSLRKT